MTTKTQRHQIKIASGPNDRGAEQRGVQIAHELKTASLWDGNGELWLHDAYNIHTAMFAFDRLNPTDLIIINQPDGAHVYLPTDRTAPTPADDEPTQQQLPLLDIAPLRHRPTRKTKQYAAPQLPGFERGELFNSRRRRFDTSNATTVWHLTLSAPDAPTDEDEPTTPPAAAGPMFAPDPHTLSELQRRHDHINRVITGLYVRFYEAKTDALCKALKRDINFYQMRVNEMKRKIDLTLRPRC